MPRAGWLAFAIAALAACGGATGATPGSEVPPPRRPALRVYDCAEGEVRVVRGEDGPPPGCRRGRRAEIIERAARAGAIVWAVGNEPGWTLALYPDRFVFEGDYGETRDEGAVSGMVRDGAGRRYLGHAGAHAFAFRVAPTPCRDAMSGAPFEAEVVVTRDGREYRGCGLSLR